MIKRWIKKIANRIFELAKQYQREELYRKFGFPTSVTFYDVSFDGNVVIGEHTYINEGSRVNTGKHSKVVIGSHCAIGRFVHISSKTHDLVQPTTDDLHTSPKEQESDVRIGDEVWIADHVYIKHGVTIGNNAVIGVHAFVNRDVESFEIVGGIPIRHIRYNKQHNKFAGS